MVAQRARLDAAKRAISPAIPFAPDVAIVLGSGLGAFADTLSDRVEFPYPSIPTMPESKVVGHAGKLVVGVAEGLRVVVMAGRVHLYEGHDPNDVVFGARLMLALGAKTLVVTNAAGGIRRGMKPGDLMVLSDHLNLTGRNCLVGENEDALGPRFPDMSTAYDVALSEAAVRTGTAAGVAMWRGVYAGLLGPTYETPAEIRMLATLGADAVGMSTVLEVIAARHMGARCVGISCITNLAAGISPVALSHAEVEETAKAVKPKFIEVLRGVLREAKAQG